MSHHVSIPQIQSHDDTNGIGFAIVLDYLCTIRRKCAWVSFRNRGSELRPIVFLSFRRWPSRHKGPLHQARSRNQTHNSPIICHNNCPHRLAPPLG